MERPLKDTRGEACGREPYEFLPRGVISSDDFNEAIRKLREAPYEGDYWYHQFLNEPCGLIGFIKT